MKNQSNTKNERGRASMRGLSGQVSGSFKSGGGAAILHKMSSGSSSARGYVSAKVRKAESEVSED